MSCTECILAALRSACCGKPYCSREHQVKDWPKHKKECPTPILQKMIVDLTETANKWMTDNDCTGCQFNIMCNKDNLFDCCFRYGSFTKKEEGFTIVTMDNDNYKQGDKLIGW